MTMTALPATPPSTTDSLNFSVRGDALLGALPQFIAEANALQADVTAKQSLATSAGLLAQAALNAGLANAAANAASAVIAATSANAAWTAALAAYPDLNPAVRMNPTVIYTDLTIPSDYNASSVGPITVGEGVNITLNDDSNWSIL